MPSFEFIQVLLKSNNPEICMTAFVDETLGELIELESACSEYKTLPHSGGYLDQLSFYTEAFQIIRAEKVRYENKRNKDAMKDLKTSNKSNQQPKHGLRKRLNG